MTNVSSIRVWSPSEAPRDMQMLPPRSKMTDGLRLLSDEDAVM